MLRLLVITCFAWIASAADAQTQHEMTIDACTDYKAADAELSAVYQQILQERGNDKQFVDALKEAQRAWVRFRDAELKAIYPERNVPLAYGSAHPMCECGVLAMMTRVRTSALSEWLKNHEGDVCSGSR